MCELVLTGFDCSDVQKRGWGGGSGTGGMLREIEQKEGAKANIHAGALTKEIPKLG